MLQNKIILKSTYKFPRIFQEPAQNPKTGRYADCVRKVNSAGDMILSEDDRKSNKVFIPLTEIIELYDGVEFDLDDELDAARWESIRFSRRIAQDRWERDKNGNLIVDGNAKRYGTAEFFVERPGMESRIRNDRRKKTHEAKTYIYDDKESNLFQMVKLLGNAMTGQPFSDVEDYLLSIAEKTPDKILELYTGTDTHLRILLVDAIDKHVIYNKDKLYYFGENIPLGATEQSVITYFKTPSNKRIVDMIKADVYPDMYKVERASIDELSQEDFNEADEIYNLSDVQESEIEIKPKVSSRARSPKS